MSTRSRSDTDNKARGSVLSLNQRPPGGASFCRGAVASSEGRAFSERDSSPRLLAFAAAALLLAALPALAKAPHKMKLKAAPSETATIENTGSTNTTGYKITVTQTGNSFHAEAVSTGGDHNGEAGNKEPLRSQVRKLFTDLAVAMPLTSLPAHHGVRSVSFGTTTFITYKGQRSPDLTFGGNPRADALKADVAAITQALHVRSGPRRPFPLRPLTP